MVLGVKHFIFGQEEEVNIQLANDVQRLGCGGEKATQCDTTPCVSCQSKTF